MVFRWLLGLALFSSLSAAADDAFGYGKIGEPPAHPLTYEQMRDAVRGERLTSVEALLAWISRTHPEFFENFTLMRESRSTQAATGKDPRAIVFQQDGRLVLTFNGDAQEQGFERVEILQFREPNAGSPVGSHFEFREILFHDGKAELSEANPNRCRQCHQAQLRPIWPPYEIWPGSYGKYDDSLPDYEHDKYARTRSDAHIEEETATLRDYQKFSPGWPKHPRYRYLKFPVGSPVTPFNTTRRGEDKFRPNLHLTHLIGNLHAREVAGQLALNKPCFETYRPLLVAGLLDCGGDSYGHAADLEKQLRSAGVALHELYSGAENAGGLYHYDVADRVPDLLALMGMEKEQWNPDENPAVWHYFVGVADIAGLVADALYPLAKLSDPTLPEFSVVSDYLRPPLYGSDDDRSEMSDGEEAKPLPMSLHEKVCRQLGDQVAKLKPQPALCRQTVPEKASVVVGMCLSCHDGKTPGAPAIALQDREWLARSDDWRARIRERVEKKGVGAMPPTRTLATGEKRALLEYLEGR